MEIRRGDIYYADLTPVVGCEQGGRRPVLVIQNDVGNHHGSTVIVAAITSRRRRRRKQTKAEKTKRTPSLPRDPEKRRGERIKTRESM